MTHLAAIAYARKQLADDVDTIDIIGDLETRGFTPTEAEEIVEVAEFDQANGEPMP